MAAEGDDGVGGMVTMYFCGEAGFGSKKRSTTLTSRISMQKSKDASRHKTQLLRPTCVLRRGKTSKTQVAPFLMEAAMLLRELSG